MRVRAQTIAAVAMAIFLLCTASVLSGATRSIDARAFLVAASLRSPWLDRIVKAYTHLGLIAVVGPALAIGAVVLYRRGYRRRAVFLILGCALQWGAVWGVKHIVDRARPSSPLVHTTGASFPSAHAANSVGWLALALALGVLIPRRRARLAVIVAGGMLALLIALSRVYLRAHYFSDIVGGESLAVSMYAIAAILCAREEHRSDQQ